MCVWLAKMMLTPWPQSSRFFFFGPKLDTTNTRRFSVQCETIKKVYIKDTWGWGCADDDNNTNGLLLPHFGACFYAKQSQKKTVAPENEERPWNNSKEKNVLITKMNDNRLHLWQYFWWLDLVWGGCSVSVVGGGLQSNTFSKDLSWKLRFTK